jgi:GNAT superfamily N-acetyltransferase
MAIEIYESNDIEGFEDYAKGMNWAGLWWGDFEEAGVSRCYFAFEGDEVVGFQTVNGDGLCVAIEVKSAYQGQGIARSLVEESGCYKPERNECPEFWDNLEVLYA